ncbi:MAG: hypothetical protein M1820_000106 [Bogoriella megaspora]|nr:MAG: hypothetical protein M1820_000106 [Bogoriella megaspora]
MEDSRLLALPPELLRMICIEVVNITRSDARKIQDKGRSRYLWVRPKPTRVKRVPILGVCQTLRQHTMAHMFSKFEFRLRFHYDAKESYQAAGTHMYDHLFMLDFPEMATAEIQCIQRIFLHLNVGTDEIADPFLDDDQVVPTMDDLRRRQAEFDVMVDYISQMIQMKSLRLKVGSDETRMWSEDEYDHGTQSATVRWLLRPFERLRGVEKIHIASPKAMGDISYGDLEAIIVTPKDSLEVRPKSNAVSDYVMANMLELANWMLVMDELAEYPEMEAQ